MQKEDRRYMILTTLFSHQKRYPITFYEFCILPYLCFMHFSEPQWNNETSPFKNAFHGTRKP